MFCNVFGFVLQAVMMNYIVIREYKTSDIPSINNVVRKAYLSNVVPAWYNALTKEITFQLIVMSAAIMFIFMSVPLYYCILAIPLVIFIIFLLVYGSFLMKAMEIIYGKRPLQCWVAEAFEPYFSMEKPENLTYRIIPETKMNEEGLDLAKYKRKIVGTVATSRFTNADHSAWLFRLAVDKSYRQKGVAHLLVRTVQQWCRTQRYESILLAISECQENARQLFMNTGFTMKQMYHKQLIGTAVTLLMYQLECVIKPDF